MDSHVKAKIALYPDEVKSQLLKIRDAIFEVAKEECLGEITETLKWNEPSYQSKNGSTVRIDWKEKSPSTVSVYFNCKTSLVETFKEIYRDTFHYVGNREIIFQVSEKLPMVELKACISMSLRYYEIKHLPLLGA
mgnify:CR=1 FL=1